MSEVKGTKALELWCKRLIKDCPDVHIDNMTTSWRNGLAFCALVHHFRPDLIDLDKLKPENIYENNQLAYSIAEKHLGIPALLDPEDMVDNEIPDRLSILTYLSQFYQRLGHTVNTKVTDSESKISSTSSPVSTPFKFGKVALDKCTICGLPVYLAQRLIVSQKLYHRRCFRCSKCSGYLNPKNYHTINLNEFSCDTCKNEKHISKYLNNNDQIGMLAFSTDVCDTSQDVQQEEPKGSKVKSRPQSILEKINMFEKNIEKDNHFNNIDKIASISLKDSYSDKQLDDSKSNSDEISFNQNHGSESILSEKNLEPNLQLDDPLDIKKEDLYKNIPEKVYKSSKDKFDFLQTQLTDDSSNTNIEPCPTEKANVIHVDDDYLDIVKPTSDPSNMSNVIQEQDTSNTIKEQDSNVTDDNRIAQISSVSTVNLEIPPIETDKENITESEIKICVPPRKKKQNSLNKKQADINKITSKPNIEYPGHLNPFSEDEEETEHPENAKHISTNPFGSSDEEDETTPHLESPSKVPETSTPMKRLIKAYNPFWSDNEEPSSDDESANTSSIMHKSTITSSTPNLPGSTPKRRKAKAPPPPAVAAEHLDVPSTSLDDVASISSLSSHNSTVNSDQRSFGNLTPMSRKKRPAPTPPDSLSTLSGYGESLEKGVDSPGQSNNSDAVSRRVKGPAPGLPLPERRAVRLTLAPEQLQGQLDLLETQQLGLERQGVLVERMIREKCEGDDGPTAPQEEIEDLVIQLCELVNEKNDLFRKQTELMYIRRQQRLEQEQADIEHEIRVIQSRPAVNRIDADKAREEQLVARLVEIVRLRDELVQQIDAERRRERQEDLAIAASIASKRAQRNSDSNSSMKSAEAVTPVKKNKVKDKVKKQFKKAKHSLISKKKDDDKPEKEKKSK